MSQLHSITQDGVVKVINVCIGYIQLAKLLMYVTVITFSLSAYRTCHFEGKGTEYLNIILKIFE